MVDWTGTSPRELLQAHLCRPANTRRGYKADLDQFARWLGQRRVDRAVAALINHGRGGCKRLLLEWITDMRARALSGNTIRRRVAAVTSLIAMALDLEIVNWSIGRLPLPPAQRVRDVAGPSVDAVDRMFSACRQRDDAKGARDHAMLALLYWEALRSAEVLSLRVRDLDLDGQKIKALSKRGQGRLELGVCRKTCEALSAWLAVRGDAPGPLFTATVHRGREADSRALSYWGLLEAVQAMGRQAGVRCWPHGLRHTAITQLANQTSDSPVLGMALSRHRDVRAWMLYQDRRVSHASAAEILSRGLIVRSEPQCVQ